MSSFREMDSLFSITILIMPNTALLNAKGSLELVGFNPIPKKPIKVSNLSARATQIAILSLGTLSDGPKGK